jgi:hypothetical protein
MSVVLVRQVGSMEVPAGVPPQLGGPILTVLLRVESAAELPISVKVELLLLIV